MRLKQIVGVICILLMSGLAFGAGEVVTVDMRAAILKSAQGKAELAKLKSTFAKDEASMLALQDELKELKERIDKDSAVMSAEERQKIEQQGADKLADYQHQGNKFKKKAKEAEQKLFKSIFPEFERALKSIMESKKYGMIVRRETVLLVSPDKDITDAVIEKMNSK